MIRTFLLISLLGAIFYCAAAAPARAHEAGGYAVAAQAHWRAQRQFLPGSLVAHNMYAHALAVASHATTKPEA